MTFPDRLLFLGLMLALHGAAQTQPTVTPALLTELDTVVPAAMKGFDVPGAGVAVIQNGQVVYAKGFGVRNLTTGKPFTADTVFRIGSTTKSMTAMLAASQVDSGLFGWDTPISDFYPALRLTNSGLAKTLTVRQAMGMGTGLGENPIELYADLYTPQYYLKSLTQLPVIATPFTTFFYNNSVFALGGYVGSFKQGVETKRLLRSYTNEMRKRLFQPIGMATTGVTNDPSTLGDNFAVSYGYHLPDGVAPTYRLPFEPIDGLSPAGAVATTLNDMSRYIVTQLRRGLSPSGVRVVSAENLTETWKGQTPLNPNASYGMGWIEQKTPAGMVLNHGGSADGFRTDMLLLPDAGIGILIFANSDSGSALINGVRGYIYDRLTNSKSSAIETAAADYEKQKQERQSLRASVKSFKVDKTTATPLLGTYEKGWKVEYGEDQTLWLTRESGYRLALLPTANGYLIGSGEEFAGFGMTVKFTITTDGGATMVLTKGTETIDTLLRLGTKLSAGDVLTVQKVKAALPKLNSLVEDVLAKSSIPGLAIGVVYKDEIVYLKGFGVREAGKTLPVTEDTVFQLASMSKPIASTVVSAIVTSGSASWTDPVVKHDPEFKLYDPWITDHVTIADFFSHRSGLYPNAGNDIEGLGYSRDEIMQKLRLLKPTGDFRLTYAYSNFGLTEGGLAAARSTGKSWEQISAEKLYQPLGMTSTSSSYQDFTRRENRASLHVLVGGKWTAKILRNADAQSPAGGVSSSIRDLMQWVRLELGNGKYDGQPLISADALDAARQPAISRGKNPDTGAPAFYGYGWNIDYEKNGQLRLGHAGAFSVGARTLVTLLPEEGLGIVILANAFPTGVPEGIVETFLDVVRTGQPTKDWIAIWNARVQTLVDSLLESSSQFDHPPAQKMPPLPLQAYAGKYRNDYLGDAEVVVQNGELRILLGPAKKSFTLEHWDRDTFLYRPVAETPEYRASVTFSIGPDQSASQVVLGDLNDDGQGMLIKVKSN